MEHTCCLPRVCVCVSVCVYGDRLAGRIEYSVIIVRVRVLPYIRTQLNSHTIITQARIVNRDQGWHLIGLGRDNSSIILISYSGVVPFGILGGTLPYSSSIHYLFCRVGFVLQSKRVRCRFPVSAIIKGRRVAVPTETVYMNAHYSTH